MVLCVAHHVRCYAFQTWKLLSSVWTAKDFARDASTLAKLGRREYQFFTHMTAQRVKPDRYSVPVAQQLG